jgi:hypothetical protein
MRRICLPRRKDDVKEQRKKFFGKLAKLYLLNAQKNVKKQRKKRLGKLAIIFVKHRIEFGKEQYKMGNGHEIEFHVVKMQFFHVIQNVLQLCSCDRKCKKSFDRVLIM